MLKIKLIQLATAAMLTVASSTVLADMVNINQASAEAIAHNLSGIGLKKAEAIVKYRNDNGVFKTVDALTEVKGIGEKLLAKNLADISLSKGVVELGASAPKVVKISDSKKSTNLKKISADDKMVASSIDEIVTPKEVKTSKTTSSVPK